MNKNLCSRCKCLTKAGERCKKTTCKYLECCYMHTIYNGTKIKDHQLVKGLFVKRSTIKGAGLGLFTRLPIKKGSIVGLYCGKQVKAGSKGAYIMQCGKRIVDAFDKHAIDSSALRYANTWRNSSELRHQVTNSQGRQLKRLYNNMKIMNQASKQSLCCTVRASRNIAAGSELLLSYGRSYKL